MGFRVADDVGGQDGAVDPQLGSRGSQSSNQLAAPTMEGDVAVGVGADGARPRGDKTGSAGAAVGRGAIARQKTWKVRGYDIWELTPSGAFILDLTCKKTSSIDKRKLFNNQVFVRQFQWEKSSTRSLLRRQRPNKSSRRPELARATVNHSTDPHPPGGREFAFTIHEAAIALEE